MDGRIHISHVRNPLRTPGSKCDGCALGVRTNLPDMHGMIVDGASSDATVLEAYSDSDWATGLELVPDVADGDYVCVKWGCGSNYYLMFFEMDSVWEHMDLPDETVVFRKGCAADVCVTVSEDMLPGDDDL